MEPGATRPSQNPAVLRNKSACLGARPSVIGHSQETRSCHYGNSPGMITEPGGPPRAKDTSHLVACHRLGRDLPVGGARTIAVGWNPDTTYWLTDCLDPAGPATPWEQVDDHPARWIHAVGS